MNKFLDAYNITKLNKDEINSWNGSITSNETGEVIKSLPTNKGPRPDILTPQLYQNSNTT